MIDMNFTHTFSCRLDPGNHDYNWKIIFYFSYFFLIFFIIKYLQYVGRRGLNFLRNIKRD